MSLEREQLREVLRTITEAGYELPANVAAVQDAEVAALTIGNAGAAERMHEAIKAGNPGAARVASKAAATPIQIDVEGIQQTAYYALRAAAMESDLWSRMTADYAAAGVELSEALKLADPAAGMARVLFKAEKVREAFASAPLIQAKCDSIAGLLQQYTRIVADLTPPKQRYTAGLETQVGFHVRDEKAKRRELSAVWDAHGPGDRLTAIIKAGGTLEAPAVPSWPLWELPEIVRGVDPLTATPEELESAEREQEREKWERTARPNPNGPGPIEAAMLEELAAAEESGPR